MAKLAVSLAAWSPLLTTESMSREAAYATVISHYCESTRCGPAAEAVKPVPAKMRYR